MGRTEMNMLKTSQNADRKTITTLKEHLSLIHI